MPKVLNVGGGPVSVPPEYQGWDVVLLDIDPDVQPDICLDAREMATLEPAQFDAVYASHVLEHFAECDVGKVLWGFYHVLTWDGYADIRVPDVQAVVAAVVERGLDLDAVLYQAPVGPIRVCDVLWGWQKQIAESGQLFYSHRFGFSRDMLGRALKVAHFEHILIGGRGYEIRARAYKHCLEELGYDEKGSGAAAISRAQNGSFDNRPADI